MNKSFKYFEMDDEITPVPITIHQFVLFPSSWGKIINTRPALAARWHTGCVCCSGRGGAWCDESQEGKSVVMYWSLVRVLMVKSKLLYSQFKEKQTALMYGSQIYAQ